MKKVKGLKGEKVKGLTAKPTITLDDVHEDVATWENQGDEKRMAKPKTRKPMAEYNGDAATEFGNDILDSNPCVAYVYDGEDQMQFMFSTPEDAVKADKMVDFTMELMERLVFAAQAGVKVLDKPRTKWPAGKRPANEPQVVNPIRKGGAK